MNRVLSFPRKRESKVVGSLWTPAFAGVTIAERRSLLSHTLASGNPAQIPNALRSGRRGPTGVRKDVRLPDGLWTAPTAPDSTGLQSALGVWMPAFAGMTGNGGGNCWLESAAVPCFGPQYR